MRKSMGINVEHLTSLHEVIAGQCIDVGWVWHLNYAGKPETPVST